MTAWYDEDKHDTLLIYFFARLGQHCRRPSSGHFLQLWSKFDNHTPSNISLASTQVILFDHFLTTNRFVFWYPCLNVSPVSISSMFQHLRIDTAFRPHGPPFYGFTISLILFDELIPHWAHRLLPFFDIFAISSWGLGGEKRRRHSLFVSLGSGSGGWAKLCNLLARTCCGITAPAMSNG